MFEVVSCASKTCIYNANCCLLYHHHEINSQGIINFKLTYPSISTPCALLYIGSRSELLKQFLAYFDTPCMLSSIIRACNACTRALLRLIRCWMMDSHSYLQCSLRTQGITECRAGSFSDVLESNYDLEAPVCEQYRILWLFRNIISL
jgi:hypothetical protein